MLLVATPWLLRRKKLRSWPRWRIEAREARRGWGEVVAKGAPAAVMVTSEWFGWEVGLFIVSGLCGGREACPAVEAIPICTTIFVCEFIFIFGAPLAASIRVGNLLGEGRGADAKFCAAVAWLITATGATLLAALLLSQRHRIGALFVDDAQILHEIVDLMPYTTTYSVLASLACGWSQQVLFGLGAPLRVPAFINFTSFFGIGLPFGSVLAYRTTLGVRGLWAGLDVAVGLIVLGQYTYMALTTDWAESARIAREHALAKDTRGGQAAIALESDGQGLAVADSAQLAVET